MVQTDSSSVDCRSGADRKWLIHGFSPNIRTYGDLNWGLSGLALDCGVGKKRGKYIHTSQSFPVKGSRRRTSINPVRSITAGCSGLWQPTSYDTFGRSICWIATAKVNSFTLDHQSLPPAPSRSALIRPQLWPTSTSQEGLLRTVNMSEGQSVLISVFVVKF